MYLIFFFDNLSHGFFFVFFLFNFKREMFFSVGFVFLFVSSENDFVQKKTRL